MATADTPAAVYYNPAGITQLSGNNFRGGIYGILLEPTFKSPSGREFDNQDPLHAVPQILFTHSSENLPIPCRLCALESNRRARSCRAGAAPYQFWLAE